MLALKFLNIFPLYDARTNTFLWALDMQFSISFVSVGCLMMPEQIHIIFDYTMKRWADAFQKDFKPDYFHPLMFNGTLLFHLTPALKTFTFTLSYHLNLLLTALLFISANYHGDLSFCIFLFIRQWY